MKTLWNFIAECIEDNNCCCDIDLLAIKGYKIYSLPLTDDEILEAYSKIKNENKDYIFTTNEKIAEDFVGAYILNEEQKDFLWTTLEMQSIWEEEQVEYNYDFWANKVWNIERNSEPIEDFPYSLWVDDFEYDRMTKEIYWFTLSLENEVEL